MLNFVEICKGISATSGTSDSFWLFLCLLQPQYKDLFEEIDQEVNGIKDRVLVKQELKNQVSRIREKNHVASGRQRSYGPTTPMN